MTEEFKTLVLAVGGCVIGLSSATIFFYRREISEEKSGPFNVHGWYAAGILGFLLVCAIASDWGSIPELATILSFAVGLASLILALIAIIQALTSTSDVQAALAAIRQSAEGAIASGVQLAESVDTLKQASEQVRKSASLAANATQNFTKIGSSVLESTKESRQAVDKLRDEVRTRLLVDTSKGEHTNLPLTKSNAFPNGVTYGGAAVSYCAVRSWQASKPFTSETFMSDIPNAAFERGYLAALDDTGLITLRRSDDSIRILNVSDELLDSLELIKQKTFSDAKLNEEYKGRIRAIEEFFSEEG